MTSRERVLAAINHQQTEQIPVDMGSNLSSGISAMGYTKLKKALGIETGQTRIFHVVQQLAQMEYGGTDAKKDGRMNSTDPCNLRWWKITDACQAPLPGASGPWLMMHKISE